MCIGDANYTAVITKESIKQCPDEFMNKNKTVEIFLYYIKDAEIQYDDTYGYIISVGIGNDLLTIDLHSAKEKRLINQIEELTKK